jgi:hypothetical protein
MKAMKDHWVSKLTIAEEAFRAIDDLPAEPAKSFEQNLEDLLTDIKKLQERRDKLGSVVEIGSFERLNFGITKDRLARELKHLNQELNGGS